MIGLAPDERARLSLVPAAPGTRSERRAVEAVTAAVLRLIDGSTRVDRQLRRSIMLSAAILGAWLVF